MNGVSIDDHPIARDSPAFVIAEAGVNYYELAASTGVAPIDAARAMIEAAARAGAHAIKFQTYKAEKLASQHAQSYWDRTREHAASQRALFAKYDAFGEDDYKELAAYAGRYHITFLSTPFDEESADLLNGLVPAFKIASADITTTPLIEHVAQKGKPVLLSTGASTIEEIAAAVQVMRSVGNEQIVLMHCVLAYPTAYRDASLGMIRSLADTFPGCVIGYSDHTVPDARMLVLTAAYLLGATVLEKHFTLDRSLPGNDHYHAMDEGGLRMLIANLACIDTVTRGTEKAPLPAERTAITHARRSVVAARDIPKGTIVTRDAVAFKRPGTGISPRDVQIVLGKPAARDIREDDVIRDDDVL